jgi:Arc/MetJ family transcription regulator
MRTNIVLEDELIQQAMRVSGLRTKRAAVEAGLRLLIDLHGQVEIRKLRGKVTWEGNLNDMRVTRSAENPPDYEAGS